MISHLSHWFSQPIVMHIGDFPNKELFPYGSKCFTYIVFPLCLHKQTLVISTTQETKNGKQWINLMSPIWTTIILPGVPKEGSRYYNATGNSLPILPYSHFSAFSEPSTVNFLFQYRHRTQAIHYVHAEEIMLETRRL